MAKWNEGSFMEGAIAGAMSGAAIGTVVEPVGGTIAGAIGGAIIGGIIKSPLFVILGSVLIGIFLLGGATIFIGIPWWVIVGIIMFILFLFSRK